MVCIVSWVGKLLFWCGGSRVCSGGGSGKLGSVLVWCIELFGDG
jgi:hypothetical protein